MSISELLKSIKEKALRHKEGATAAWDAFKGDTGMIPKEEQTIGNLKYAIGMNAEQMEPNEINFVDFNGLVLSMTIEEVMQLTEMPKPNEYYNLTFEHWTKTLEEIQDGRCHTVGATYHTTDGKLYIVVDIPYDNCEFNFHNPSKNGNGQVTDWGDGTEPDIQPIATNSRIHHTYSKKGKYIIVVDSDNGIKSNCGYAVSEGNATDVIIEEYLPEQIEEIYLNSYRALKKISIPYGKENLNLRVNLRNTDKLENLVLSKNIIFEAQSMGYLGINMPSIKYIVADNFKQGLWDRPMWHNSLRAFSFANVTDIKSSSVLKGIRPRYPFLRTIVFDNLVSIASCFIYGGNNLISIDLPETIQSISNSCLRIYAPNVYIRSLTPPTLGGTDVFWYQDYGKVVTIHIRKDATYTDAEGTTWTGLEAYAHATNWATLYANTNYTFIDDL